jgi:hypothetical protein
MLDCQTLSIDTQKESKFSKTRGLLGMDSKVFPGETLAHHIGKFLAMKDSKDGLGTSACSVLHNRFVVMKWYHYNPQKEGFRLNEYRCTESKYLS